MTIRNRLKVSASAIVAVALALFLLWSAAGSTLLGHNDGPRSNQLSLRNFPVDGPGGRANEVSSPSNETRATHGNSSTNAVNPNEPGTPDSPATNGGDDAGSTANGQSHHTGASGGYSVPWDSTGARNINLEFTVQDVAGIHRDIDGFATGLVSLIHVQLTNAPPASNSVHAEVYLPTEKKLLRAPCRREHGIWRASFSLPLGVLPPVFIRFSAADSQWIAMLTRAQIAGRTSMLPCVQRTLFANVDASVVAANITLPKIRCQLATGRPCPGIAAQFRTLDGSDSGDHSLLGVSSQSGVIGLSHLWCAGVVEQRGLLLHAPGMVPSIVTPEELASAQGGELLVTLKHHDVRVTARADLSQEELAAVKIAWNRYTVPVTLDLIPLHENGSELDQTPIGQLFACTLSDLELEQSWEAGWNYQRLETLLGRKAARSYSDEDGGFNPMELLTWYRNQRDYDDVSGVWNFTLPCSGIYAVVLDFGYDAQGRIQPRLTLLIDARRSADAVIRVLK